MLGSQLNLLEMFEPVIPELTAIEATEEEVRHNLERPWPVDLLTVFEHRTECEGCTRESYNEECPFLLYSYEIIRSVHGLQVMYEFTDSCRAKNDPYRQSRIDELIANMRLPYEFKDKTIKEYDPKDNESQKEAKKQIAAYVNGFEPHYRMGEGLVITGPTGTGKTHLVVGMAKGLIQLHLHIVHFVDVGVWASDFVYGSRSFDEKKKTIESMKFADVLVLDDLGAEMELKNRANVTGSLQTVLLYRYNEAKPTIITTNIKSDDLKTHLGQRVWSRLEGKCQFIPVVGPDQRVADTSQSKSNQPVNQTDIFADIGRVIGQEKR